MDKEIVTLADRFTTWKVYRSGKHATIEKTKPMTPSQALKHFKAYGVLGITKN